MSRSCVLVSPTSSGSWLPKVLHRQKLTAAVGFESKGGLMSEGYGSIEGLRPGGTTGKENYEVYQERRRMETLEHSDEKVTIRKYLVFGGVIAVLVSLALYTLWGRVSAQMAHISNEKAHMAGAAAEGERVGGGQGEGDSSRTRLRIKHLLQRPAIEQAQSYTWEQVEDWGKAHPTRPVRIGMVEILETDSAKYKEIVTKKVVKSLTDVQTCDASNVCKANPIAGFIRSRACPSDRPCSASVLSDIARLAHWAAKIAVDAAFQGLKDQVQAKPANPFHGKKAPGIPTSPALPYSIPGVVGRAGPAAYRQAAEQGMGYQPGGYQPVPGQH